jgi:branched-chain amino acid transport system ATP-binding protein
MSDTMNAIRGMGVMILIVEQNAHRTLQMAHHAYVLENGGIALHGEARSCAENPLWRSDV